MPTTTGRLPPQFWNEKRLLALATQVIGRLRAYPHLSDWEAITIGVESRVSKETARKKWDTFVTRCQEHAAEADARLAEWRLLNPRSEEPAADSFNFGMPESPAIPPPTRNRQGQPRSPTVGGENSSELDIESSASSSAQRIRPARAPQRDTETSSEESDTESLPSLSRVLESSQNALKTPKAHRMSHVTVNTKTGPFREVQTDPRFGANQSHRQASAAPSNGQKKRKAPELTANEIPVAHNANNPFQRAREQPESNEPRQKHRKSRAQAQYSREMSEAGGVGGGIGGSNDFRSIDGGNGGYRDHGTGAAER